jgi:hypothetical protein
MLGLLDTNTAVSDVSPLSVMGTPTSEQWNQLFQVFAITNLVLFVKYYVSVIYASGSDHLSFEDDVKIVPDIFTNVSVKRRQISATDDVENIPIHLFVFLAAFVVQNFCNASGHGEQETLALTCLLIIYCACRALFTVLYLFALQPYSNAVFMISQLTMFATICVLIAASFQVEVRKVFPYMGW